MLVVFVLVCYTKYMIYRNFPISIKRYDEIEEDNSLFIAVNVAPGGDFKISLQDAIVKEAVRIGMYAFRMNHNDYKNYDSCVYWLVGSDEAVTMFSLKYKKYIVKQLTKRNIVYTMELLTWLASKYPKYYIDYMDAIYHLVTDTPVNILRIHPIDAEIAKLPLIREIRFKPFNWGA